MVLQEVGLNCFFVVFYFFWKRCFTKERCIQKWVFRKFEILLSSNSLLHRNLGARFFFPYAPPPHVINQNNHLHNYEEACKMKSSASKIERFRRRKCSCWTYKAINRFLSTSSIPSEWSETKISNFDCKLVNSWICGAVSKIPVQSRFSNATRLFVRVSTALNPFKVHPYFVSSPSKGRMMSGVTFIGRKKHTVTKPNTKSSGLKITDQTLTGLCLSLRILLFWL